MDITRSSGRAALPQSRLHVLRKSGGIQSIWKARMMGTGVNFIKVSDKVMMDPVSKLSLRQSRFDFCNGYPYSQTIQLEFDPKMRVDRLLVPMTDDEERSFGVGSGPNGHMRPFQSEQLVQVLSFLFYIYLNEEPGRLTARLTSAAPDISQKILERELGISRPYARELYAYLVMSLPEMQTWDELALSYNRNPPNADRQLSIIDFCVTAPVAALVPTQSDVGSICAKDGGALLCSRSVRS